VTGLNRRLSDNLMQLAAVVIGTLYGGRQGWWYWYHRAHSATDSLWMIFAGAVAGLLGALFLSGLLIGLVRRARKS
jgi:hypothetical protein